jgi:riboflavin kinase/FMN adenylyltransferase
MQTLYGYPDQPFDHPTCLTIGNFDGVHRGHQALITEMVRAARDDGSLAGLLMFDPHPLAVLRPDLPLSYLTTADERAAILAALGLDFVLVLPFTRETAATSAADFMARLAERIRLRELWIGPDFALGRGREGTAGRLAELGAELGYRVRVAPPFDWCGELVRSSRVRALLAQEGAVAQAGELLGHPYQVWGQVQPGARRGHALGFPTANLALPSGRLTPAFGVYACWVWREERGYPAVVNVGVRPSFDHPQRTPGSDQPTVEAYLLSFDEELYGETLGLSFIKRLREEKRFAVIHDLVAQIRADAEAARRVLADPPDHTGAAEGQMWEELPHTADWAIRVTGASQRQLFARVAASMFGLQDADRTRPITLARTVAVTADNVAELLVAWLNQLLLGQDVGGEMYTRFEIHELSDRGLRGVAYGYHGAPSHTAVKAATYYDLSVQEIAEGWEARVTFDV